MYTFICLNSTAQYKSAAFTLKSVKTDKISLNTLINKSGQLNPFIQPNPISGLSISANITLNSDSSLIRILLVDENYREYLAYETYPILADSNKFSISGIGEETAELNNIIPTGLRFEIVDASILLKEIFIGKELKSAKILSRSQLQEQDSEKINKINKKIKLKGEKWIAGETFVSKLTYEEKKQFFGGKVPNLQGFEYYKGGIYVMPGALDFKSSEQSNMNHISSASISPFALEFSWRNRHGQDWMTPVKNQGGCGGCWAFGTTGATELLVNLFYNRHINVDLSEQQLISCSVTDGCSGGTAVQAFNYVLSEGIVNEDCFPYVASNSTCENMCSSPTERIRIGAHSFVYAYNTDSLKKSIIKGPIAFAIYNWNHLITLAGYKTLCVGDMVYKTNDNFTWVNITDGDILIGQTAWLIKNSWGTDWGDNGYAYIVTNIHGTEANKVTGPLNSMIYHDSDILCVDNDGDGYYNWGIGPKPAHCPACPNEPDGDDSNACVGPMDEFGNYQYVSPQPIAHDVNVRAGEPAPALIAEGNNIKWYDNETLTNIVYSGNSYATGLSDVGKYQFYVTQTIDGCESKSTSVSLTIYLEIDPPVVVNDFIGCVGQPVQISASGENIKWYYDTNNPIVDIRDGQSYKIVKIGSQLWMAENLNYYTLSGSSYYNRDSLTYSEIYGRLYDWETANEVCPTDWELPSKSDWQILLDFCGGSSEAGGKLKETGTLHWNNPNTLATDDFGFKALPSGMGWYSFSGLGSLARFWSSSTYYTNGDNRTFYNCVQLYNDASSADITGGPNGDITTAVRCINKTTDIINFGNQFSRTFSSPGKYVYFVTQTISGFESPADTVIISINSYTEPPKCNNVTSAYGQPIPFLFAEGMNIKWYSGLELTNLIGSGNEFTTGKTEPGSYEYYVTQTNGCESEPAKVTLTIFLPGPSAENKAICFGDLVPDLTASGNDIRWYSDAGLKNLLHSGDNYPTGKTQPGIYTYYVTQTINGYQSSSTEVCLTIRNTPSSPSAINLSVCQNSPVPELSASGNNIKWYSDDNLSTLLHTGSSYMTGKTQPGVYTYYTTQTVNECQSPSTEVSLTIKTAPSSPSANNLSVCQNYPVPELSASGNNIKWYGDANLSILLHTGSSYATGETQPGVYTFYATQTINECQSPATRVSLTINTIPSSPTAIDESVCRNSVIPELSASGTNIKWYGDANLSILLHTGSSYMTGKTQPGVYTYYATQTINECQSEGITVTLNINETPELFLGNDTRIYQKEILKLNVTEGFKSYQWFNGASSSSIELRGDQLELGNNDIWLIVTDNNDCSATDTIIVTVIMETGVNTVDASEIIQIFPNPNTGSLNIRFLNKESYNTQISLLNQNGKVLIQKKLKQIQENEIFILDLSSLPSGTYLVHIITDEISLYNKVIRID